MQTPEKIENAQEKNNVRARKIAVNGIGNFAWASGITRIEACDSCKKFSVREREAKKKNETPYGALLGKIASGSYSAGPLAGREKSGISGNRRRLMPTP